MVFRGSLRQSWWHFGAIQMALCGGSGGILGVFRTVHVAFWGFFGGGSCGVLGWFEAVQVAFWGSLWQFRWRLGAFWGDSCGVLGFLGRFGPAGSGRARWGRVGARRGPTSAGRGRGRAVLAGRAQPVVEGRSLGRLQLPVEPQEVHGCGHRGHRHRSARPHTPSPAAPPQGPQGWGRAGRSGDSGRKTPRSPRPTPAECQVNNSQPW